METMAVDNQKIDRLLQELDAGRRKMLLYLLKYKHAGLNELMEVLGGEGHV